MRGLPGSGKSTFLKQNHPNATVCSADHYFMEYDPITEESKYNFSVTKLGEAHDYCYQLTNMFFDTYISHKKQYGIAIDNTNTQLWEFSGYVQLARYHGFKVIVHQFRSTLGERCFDKHIRQPEDIESYINKCHRRCVHGVPLEAMFGMQRRSQKIPPHWDVEIINHHGDDRYKEPEETFRKQSHDATSDIQSKIHNS